jgi:hypothetical protein
MLNAAAAACFAGFLALVAAVSAAGRWRPQRRKAAVNLLLAYALAASFAVGLSQRDAWPFAKWPMAGGRADATAANSRVVALDAGGGEHPIDYRAWQPLGFDELLPWMHLTFPRLRRAEQDQAAAFLLQRAETARRRAAAGGRVGATDRLGPLTAPGFDLHPRTWTAGALPAAPFVGLRVYRESWNQEERRRDPSRVSRRLFYEYRAP